MGGKWNKWYMAPLYVIGIIINLPRMIWRKIFPPRMTPNAVRPDDLPVTPEEDEARREMERKQ